MRETTGGVDFEVQLRAVSLADTRADEDACGDRVTLPVSALHPDDMSRLRLFAGSVARQGVGWTDELTYLTRLEQRIPTEASASLCRLDGSRLP